MAPSFAPKKGLPDSHNKGQRIRKKTPGKDIKRRTKTGCLTCRQRRIKCDENKPCCLRCQKSRKICDYSARLVFLDCPPQVGREAGNQPFDQARHPTGWEGFQDPSRNDGSQRPPHAPFPPFRINTFDTAYDDTASTTSTTQSDVQALAPSPTDGVHHLSPNGNGIPRFLSFEQKDAPRGPFPSFRADRASNGYSIPDNRFQNLPGDPQFPATEGLVQTSLTGKNGNGVLKAASPPGELSSSWKRDQQYSTSANAPYASTTTMLVVTPNVVSNSPLPTPTSAPIQGQGESAFQWKPIQPFGRAASTTSPIVDQILDNGTVEWETNDYYDVSSDEEDDATDSPIPSDDEQYRLDELVTGCGEDAPGMRLLGDPCFTQPWTVDDYRPERTANPLRNPWTRLLFEYFVKSTGPGLSVFQSRLTTSTHHHSWPFLHSSRVGLWTDMMPKLAFQDQSLLQAMLATSTMELAHKHGQYDTYSAKHYIWATRRINRALNERNNRCSTTLLAATLLLAFYEVMTAEHTRWSTHLVGARQLILENDYSKMSGKLLQVTNMQHARRFRRSTALDEPLNYDCNVFPPTANVLNMQFISQLVGFPPNYADNIDFGQTPQDGAIPTNLRSPQDRAKLIQYQDLFWWYARQDMIHSIISGASLL